MLHARGLADRFDLTNGAKTAFSIRTEFLVSTGIENPEVRPDEIKPKSSTASERNAVPQPLDAKLKEAETRTGDPKLKRKLVAVLRYNRYFENLKVLKTACKRYQTPALLEQQFPDLDVWAAMDDADKTDIAKGEFNPGHFACALVMRLLNLTGNDNRTLKNYRKALKAAGLL